MITYPWCTSDNWELKIPSSTKSKLKIFNTALWQNLITAFYIYIYTYTAKKICDIYTFNAILFTTGYKVTVEKLK